MVAKKPAAGKAKAAAKKPKVTKTTMKDLTKTDKVKGGALPEKTKGKSICWCRD